MKKQIFLIGIGTGRKNLLTVESLQTLQSCQIIFGAARMISFLAKNPELAGVPKMMLYDAKKIADLLKNKSEYTKVAVLFSGDTGFYSGAAKFFEDKNLFADWEITVENGISSPVYFASKLGKPWQNWKFLSLHGAKCNFIEQIRKNPSCFFILSGVEDLKSVGEKLEKAVANKILNGIKCYLGANLSYPNEKITEITAEELQDFNNVDEDGEKSLFVLLVENENAGSESTVPVLNDEDFIRAEKIPMTKKEVRQLSICSLALSENSVFYDIGCGTGSISVEAARIATEGQVFAVDCKNEAVTLTNQNVQKFCLENVTCLNCEATDFLKDEDIPAPTHAFIGGSGGNLCEIVRLLLQKNPNVKITANFVSLENLCEMQNVLKSLEKDLENADRFVEVKQIAVSRAEKAGNFNLMKAQNPVWIVSIV